MVYYQLDSLPQADIMVTYFHPALNGDIHQYKTIVTTGYNKAADLYFVIDALITKDRLEILIKKTIDSAVKYDAQHIGLTDNYFSRLLLSEFSRTISIHQAAKTLPVRTITFIETTETRVMKLSKLIKAGKLVSTIGDYQQEIIEQVLDFPYFGTSGADALAGSITLINEEKKHVKRKSVKTIPTASMG